MAINLTYLIFVKLALALLFFTMYHTTAKLVSGYCFNLGPRSFECILIGYAGNSKAYRCYHRATNKVIESFHVRFIESEDELPRPLLPGVVISLPLPNNIPDIHHSPLPPCASPPPLRCSSRIRGVAADPVALQLDCTDPSARNPLSFGEARRSVDWPLWEHMLQHGTDSYIMQT
jgi:hypothetical protein